MNIAELPSADLLPSDLLRQYANVPTSIISDSMDRVPGAVGLLPMREGLHLVGTALTVRTRPGDNLAIHAALKNARPGEVLVIDGDGDLSRALIGEVILAHAEARGVAGFVVDGVIRDVAAFRVSGTPCYARGVIHRGPYKNGPGEINATVSIGGLVVSPGDLIVGDDDGVVAVPAALAAGLLPGIRAQQENERQKLDAYRSRERLHAI